MAVVSPPGLFNRPAYPSGMASAPKKLPRWEIAIIRKRGGVIGTVEAPDAEAAVKAAIEKWGITEPERQKRLAAHRIS